MKSLFAVAAKCMGKEKIEGHPHEILVCGRNEMHGVGEKREVTPCKDSTIGIV